MCLSRILDCRSLKAHLGRGPAMVEWAEHQKPRVKMTLSGPLTKITLLRGSLRLTSLTLTSRRYN